MSRFSGPQGRGALRRLRAYRRRAADRRAHAKAVRLAADALACPGKIRFASEELAEARARSICAVTGDQMRWYGCIACGWIHLGHPPGETSWLRHGNGRRKSAADR